MKATDSVSQPGDPSRARPVVAGSGGEDPQLPAQVPAGAGAGDLAAVIVAAGEAAAEPRADRDAPSPSQASRGELGSSHPVDVIAGESAQAAVDTAAEVTADDSSVAPRTEAVPAAPDTEEPDTEEPKAEAADPDEEWTTDELAAVRAELQAEATGLRHDVDEAAAGGSRTPQESSAALGQGTDEAGSRAQAREQEMSLVDHNRATLSQVERALARLDAGTYGTCENCGTAIPKARLQAFPRATLCVACKHQEERR